MRAWAADGVRAQMCVTSPPYFGLRSSEYMLAREYPIYEPPHFNRGRVSWSLVPNITQEDNDILESMAVWWSGGPARVMREIATPMIEAAERKLRSGMFQKEDA